MDKKSLFKTGKILYVIGLVTLAIALSFFIVYGSIAILNGFVWVFVFITLGTALADEKIQFLTDFGYEVLDFATRFVLVFLGIGILSLILLTISSIFIGKHLKEKGAKWRFISALSIVGFSILFAIIYCTDWLISLIK